MRAFLVFFPCWALGCADAPRSPPRSDPTSDPTEDTSAEPPDAPVVVRVVTWNIERLGAPGDAEFEAVAAVLTRIDADVVALNEVDSQEELAVSALADALGYGDVVVADDNPFGTLHNAILTRLPLVEGRVWTAAELTGDADTNDVTRWPVTATVEVDGARLTVASNHLKSGFEDIDAFRRIVDATRTAQAALAADGDATLVVCGDLNAELADAAPDELWTQVPAGAPQSFVLGDDLATDLLDGGIPDDPFAPITALGLVRAPALQRDGAEATRDSSGRVIDHIFTDAAAEPFAEVYDARDDALAGLPLGGSAPEPDATEVAADHFPVFADLTL